MQIVDGLKDRYILMLVNYLSIHLPKYSVLCFFARIFGVKSTRFRISLWVTGALVTSSLLFAAISTIFQCTPIKMSWLPTTTGHCINEYSYFLAFSTITPIIDFIIMILPLPMLWELHTKMARKFILTGIFCCGYW